MTADRLNLMGFYMYLIAWQLAEENAWLRKQVRPTLDKIERTER